MSADISYPLAFLAGILSFVSPCVLPLFPSYISYITGVSFEDLTSGVDKGRVRRLTLINSLAFIAGFSFVFISFGVFAALVGGWLVTFKNVIRIGGGVLVIIFGLFISDIIRMDFLMREKKFHMAGKPAGIAGTFLIGMTFAAGWTPCIGPILGAILVVASTKGSTVAGAALLTVYSLGLGVPFLVSALLFNEFLSKSRALFTYMKPIKIASGVILIAFGVILLTDNLGLLASWLPDLGLDQKLLSD